MQVDIRAFTADEWPLFKELRLRAVADSPDAFRGTHDEEAALDDEQWRDMVARTAAHPDGELFLATVDGRPAGITFVRIHRDDAEASIGSMWVAPEERGRGVSRHLLHAAVDFARAGGATAVRLAVTRDNGPAQRLYETLGFVPNGETEALRTGSDLVVQWMRRIIEPT